MWSLKTFKAHCKMQVNPIRLFFHIKDGKRYLSVIRTNFKGAKWVRRFEIVTEVKPANYEPIEFKGFNLDEFKSKVQKKDDCTKQPPKN